MALTVVSVTALLVSLAILFTGNGLQGTLIAVRANLEAFSTLTIGLLQSGFYIGFTAGCLAAPSMVASAGHIRVYAAMASLASVSALTHILYIESLTWWILRATTGFCFAVLLVVSESWLNEKATNQTRGRVLSLYFIVYTAATLGGQVLLVMAEPKGFFLFCLVSILFSLSLIPVSLTRATPPAPIPATSFHLYRLIRLAPLGVVVCFGAGLANGAFWGLGPVFVQDAGLGISEVAFFISMVIVGGALSQWPVGRFSDRFDRRYVLVVVLFGAGLSGLSLAASGAYLPETVPTMGVVFGALVIPIYSLAIAHVNDFTDPSDFVETSGELLLVFGIGAIIGPIIASMAMEHIGFWALFVFTALVHFACASYGLRRIAVRHPAPVEERGRFVAVPRSTHVVFDLHPLKERLRDARPEQFRTSAEPSSPEASPKEETSDLRRSD